MFKGSTIYFLTSLLERSIPIFLVPIFTRYLTPNDYGYLAVVSSLIGIIQALILSGQNSSMQRFYFDYKSSNVHNLYFNNNLVITISAVFYVLIFYFSGLNFGISRLWFILILFIAYSKSLETLILSYFQISKQPGYYSIIRLIGMAITILISIYLIVYKGFNWQGRLIGSIFLGSIIVIINWTFIIRKGIPNFLKIDDLKKVAFYGVALVPAEISGWGLNLVDRLLIKHYLGYELTGLYNIGYQVGMLVYIVAAAFSRAWVPFFYENFLKEGKRGKIKIIKVSKIAISGIILLSSFIALTGPFFLKLIVTPPFYDAGIYIKWIVLGYTLNSIQILFMLYLTSHKKTHIISVIAAISFSTNVILNIIMIPRFGALGAAYATCLSFFLSLLLVLYYSNKLEPTMTKSILRLRIIKK